MFFDVKNHLLYGSEPFCECAQDETMAFCMAYEVYEQGGRFIMAAPPHTAFLKAVENPNADGVPAGIYKRYQSLRNRIRRSFPDMEIGLGCEIACSRSDLEQIIHHLDKGHLPTLNGSHYVLVSFPDNVSREDLWFCLNRLDQAGYSCVLSHAQSIHTLKYDIHEIKCLKGEAYRGEGYSFRCKIQLDTSSLHFSEHDMHWAREMIHCGVVDVLASNARNTFTHPAHIQDEMESIAESCPPEYLEAITWGNADSLFRPSAEGA